MSHIIAVSLEKGGVGKTTTVLNIGAGLRQVGQNVLLVDLDQQSHLSRWLSFEPDGRPTISELIYQEVSRVHSNDYTDFIRHNDKEDIDFIPANKMLGGIYAILGADGESNTVLSRIFKQEFFHRYDYILFDCPTAVDNLLVSNALQASTKLLLPIQAELLAYESVPAMLQRYMAIKQVQNIKPYIQGMLVTMFSARTNMSNDVLKALRESYGDMVFEKPIPMLQEARNSTERRSSLVSHKNSKVGQAYMAAVNEMIRRNAI
jgi:chromosome partitioning protein